MLDNFQYPISGGRGPSPMGVGSSQREIDQREIKLQVQGRSGPDYNNLAAYLPSHYSKVANLGSDNPIVIDSRRRLAGNMVGQGMEWPTIKAKVQEFYDMGKLKRWCSTPEGAQSEIDKVWKYFNAVTLGGKL